VKSTLFYFLHAHHLAESFMQLAWTFPPMDEIFLHIAWIFPP
jgi:hypothetical protein